MTSGVDQTQQIFLKKAEAEGIDNCEEISALVHDVSESCAPFKGLETECKQTAFYKEHFNYMVLL